MKTNLLIFFFLAADGLLILFLLLTHGTMISPGFLDPAGPVAAQQKGLLELAFTLAMIVILPVFALYFLITRNYSEKKKTSYLPDWTPPSMVTYLWWLIPSVVVFILAFYTWKATHALDPHTPLRSEKTPVHIQVVALRWKWLFIYPEQNIASVNFVQFPEDTPINFDLTADAPMNSFWIPQLSGQIYAMTGMNTQLHLQADRPGDYAGSTAEISGKGFSGMRFTARASTKVAFDDWVNTVKQSPNVLSLKEYEKLARPTEHHPVVFYGVTEENLYSTIIKKFMPPQENMSNMNHEMKPGMKM